MTNCPGLRVVATSRTPLGAASERVIAVPPLPAPAAPDDPTATRANPAVRLLLERARRLVPAYADDPADLPIVARICSELDGLPLAIELAAARADRLSPVELLTGLRHRLDLLADDENVAPNDATARHRSMRAAIAWSYDVLPAEEQALFRRLAFFPGGFNAETVAAVTRGGSPADGYPYHGWSASGRYSDAAMGTEAPIADGAWTPRTLSALALDPAMGMKALTTAG